MKAEYYIITSVTPGLKVHQRLLKSLLNFSKRKRAKLLIIPTKSLKGRNNNLPSEVTSFVIRDDIRLNDSLTLISQQYSPTVIDHMPQARHLLQNNRQVIIGIPRHTCKSYPRSLLEKNGYIPRIVFGTGSISKPDYPSSLTNDKTKSIHKIGALVVKVINKKVSLVSQVECLANGSFYYEKTRYNSNGSIEKIDSIPGISLGDIHLGEHDPMAYRATLDIIKHFRPKNIIYHDIFSANSISHHLANKSLTKAKRNTSLFHEFKEGAKLLKNIISCSPQKTKHLIVKSNHCEHLIRYLEEGRYTQDHENLKLAIFLLNEYFRGNDIIRAGFEYFYKSKRIEFLKRSTHKKIQGVLVSNHGDHGASGKAGNPKSLGQIFGEKIITGHQHNAEISPYGNYINGTTTFLSLPYCPISGGTTWTHTHTMIYPHGLRSHLHIINRLWR